MKKSPRKPVKKRRKGAGKGAGYERAVCRLLSRWVSAGAREDVFWRSSISGGRATFAAQKGTLLNSQAGDICAVAPEGASLTSRFFIELKHRASLDLEGFVVRHKGLLFRFWRKTISQSAQFELEPMMIVRQNFTPDLVITRPRAGFNTPAAFFYQHGEPLFTVNNETLSCEVWLLEQMLQKRYWNPWQNNA